jgi:hypothetical protein
MKARRLIEGSAFGPETMSVVSQAFDQAWATIEDHFQGDEKSIEAARLRLAHAVLVVAHEDIGGVERLKQHALELMALADSKRQ